MLSSFYRIIHRATGLALHANDSGDTYLEAFDKNNPYQIWCLFDEINITTSIYNTGSRMSLDGYMDGGRVYCTTDNANNPYQKWIRRTSNKGLYHHFVHLSGGLYLDVSEPNNVYLHPNKHGHPSQDWYLILLDQTP